ncbi:EAL domain-containing protein [Bowmanella dokdonensis]|uniref:EAL domain-containing protein n=1 Tax=Bowmanella dokdonensis TaxID=751969 RepID=A0A939DQM8_9ALTE|nr:EAL domain-containing protein [Bowmanella dokdonensis]MBN7826121.1 EAL domain-containing protein [Bowmanella dokdonensis]
MRPAYPYLFSLLLVCGLLRSAVLFAAPLIEIPNIFRVSTEEGLSQSTVNSLLLDKAGFLWLATDGGLNRFDGYRIRRIAGSEGELSENSVYELYQDSQGLIWAGTADMGLYKINPDSGDISQALVHYYKEEPTLPQEVELVREEQTGKLWVAMTEDLLLFEPDTGHHQVVFGLSEQERAAHHLIRAFAQHGDYLYIGTSAALYQLNTRTGLQRKILFEPEGEYNDSNNVKQLHLDGQGYLWAGTVKGLFRLSIADFESTLDLEIRPLPLLEGRNIWKILPDGEHLLLGTDDGLFRLDSLTGEVQHLLRLTDSRFQISDGSIIDILRDNQGNLWLATWADGAFRWSPHSLKFRNLHRSTRQGKGLSHDVIWSLHQSEDGRLWIGTEDGLSVYLPREDRIEPVPLAKGPLKPYHSGGILSILPATEGRLWLGSYEGIKLFDPASGEVRSPLATRPELSEILAGDVWGLQQDNEGNLWFASAEGFFRYQPEDQRLVHLESINENLDPGWSNGFVGEMPGQPGKMLVSMAGALWQYDKESAELSKLHQFDQINALRFQTPNSVALDNQGILWIAYSGLGLVGIDANTLETRHYFDKNSKLGSDSVYALLLDEQDNLWMSSHAGIARLNTQTLHLQRFSHLDGLATNEFNDTAVERLMDGRFAYGSVKGLTLFDPASLSPPVTAADSVVISHMDLMSNPLDMPFSDLNGREILLEHDDIGLSVHFSTLQYGELRSTQYQYRLSGTEQISYPASSDSELIIPKLNPGRYQLQIRALDPETGELSKPASVGIRVKYAPLTSPWAYALYALAALGLLAWWRHWQNRQARALMSAHEQSKASEKRLQLALQGSNSGVWDWQSDSDQMYQPRLIRELGYEEGESIHPSHYLELIHPQDRLVFERDWMRFIQGQMEQFDLSYRLRGQDGQWYWYRDLGRVVQTEDDSISQISGTYTNITDTRASEEKVRLFGEAFRHTRDWVLILNSQQWPIAANQSLCEALGLEADKDLSGQLESCFSTQQILFYRRMMDILGPGEHWRGEQEVLGNDKQLHHVMVNINAVGGRAELESDEIDYYIMVMTDISEQKAAQKELRQLANYDSLTGLPNRNLLLDRIQHAMEHAVRRRSHVAVFFIDLDKFKQVNDSLGHEAGDQLLLEVARRLRGSLRLDDTVGRLGGDEFVVILEDLGDEIELGRLASKIIEEIDQPIQIGNNQVSVSASIGIAIYPQDSDNPSELLKSADIAMYHVKATGRNRYQFFTAEMNTQARAKLALETQLKSAFKAGEFVNFYQPIVDMRKGEAIGFELLLRWQHEERLIPPAEFIPLAEELGLIIPMTWQAMDRGLRDLSEWYKSGKTPYLSVNLSARHLEKGLKPAEIFSLLVKHGLPVSALRLEITESALMEDYGKAKDCMGRLHESGIKFSLDDFGTGYSSLKYLKAFPIQTVKIDKSFVQDIGLDANDEAIIRTTLLMAESLHMNCVAEGIETTEQIRFFEQHGCHLLQGYLFSRPVPADKVPTLLSRDWLSLRS